MLSYDYYIIIIILYYHYTNVFDHESLKIDQNWFFDRMIKRCKMDFSSKISFIINKKCYSMIMLSFILCYIIIILMFATVKV